MTDISHTISVLLDSGRCFLKDNMVYLKVAAGSVAAFGAWSAYAKWRDETEAKRIEWLYNCYKQISGTQDFKDVRLAVEYNYDEWSGVVEKLCDKDGDSIRKALKELDESEKAFFMKLDDFLHFVNFLAYLKSHEHLPRTDIVIDFDYWFAMFRRPEYATLARYIRTWKYAEIVAEIERRDQAGRA